jgi:RHS repeat-associated protein
LSYDPYGQLRTASPDNARVDFRFAGQYRSPSLGLYKMGLRWYDPKTGRFTQVDPIDQAGDLREGNQYGYAGDDPVNLVHLAGEASCSPRGTGGTPASTCTGTGATYSGAGGRRPSAYQRGGCRGGISLKKFGCRSVAGAVG